MDPDRGYYEQAYGEAALDSQPASVKDNFLIGSITETVFATAVLEHLLALVEPPPAFLRLVPG